MAQIARLHAEIRAISASLVVLEHAVDSCESNFGEHLPQLDFDRVDRIRAKLNQGSSAVTPKKLPSISSKLRIKPPPTPAPKSEKVVRNNQIAPNPPSGNIGGSTSDMRQESAKEPLSPHSHMDAQWRSTSGLVQSALAGGSIEDRTTLISELLTAEQLASFQRKGMSMKRIVELQVLFELFDTDGNHSIDRNELALAAKHLKHLRIHNSKKLIARLGTEHDGEVSFYEFIELMCWMEAEDRWVGSQCSKCQVFWGEGGGGREGRGGTLYHRRL
jgi:hypothetical protein